MNLEDLNAMCAGRFCGLFEKVESICHSALEILSRKRTFDSPTLLLFLDAVRLEDVEEVGSKTQ